MHELSIADELLDRVRRESQQRGAHIRKVGVRVGELSGVDPAALTFGFDALVKDTPLAPLSLEVEWVRRRQHCRNCARDFEAPSSETRCPSCSTADTECVGGHELDLAWLEVDDR